MQMEWVVSWSYQEVIGVCIANIEVRGGGDDVGGLCEFEGIVGVEC